MNAALELCFESFRFWDLRRWNAPLNEAARGMDVNGAVYTPFVVENRSYQDFMRYGPIPYSEVLKFTNLLQNKGWIKIFMYINYRSTMTTTKKLIWLLMVGLVFSNCTKTKTSHTLILTTRLYTLVHSIR